MATKSRNGNGHGPVIDVNDENASKDADSNRTLGAQAPGYEIPVDDGESDNKGMLSKLALSLMGCRPELSMARERDVTINGQVSKVKVGENIHQATIFGEITGLTGPKELPNAKSDAEKYTYGLTGRIEGVNVLTGEMFKAGVLYLPAGFHDMFLAEMESALKMADQNAAIVFALQFWSIPSDNPRGYSWKAVNKMPIEKRDPLARLRARAMEGTVIKAIAAPTTPA